MITMYRNPFTQPTTVEQFLALSRRYLLVSRIRTDADGNVHIEWPDGEDVPKEAAGAPPRRSVRRQEAMPA